MRIRQLFRTPTPYRTSVACPALWSHNRSPARLHIHITSPHTLSTQLCGGFVGSGEVEVFHIYEDVPGSRDRMLHYTHVRVSLGKIVQFRSVRDEHSPPGTSTRSRRSSRVGCRLQRLTLVDVLLNEIVDLR